MRKKSAKSIFIRGFLQSFFIVILLLGAAILGYQGTMKLWMLPEEQTEAGLTPTPTSVPITAASVDDISRNLIYCYDEDKNEITKLVLEIFHCGKKQLSYITIPIDTQFTMSDTAYRRLILIQNEIPQIIRLSALTKYFAKDTVFDYGVLLTEDLLKLKISYYTVIPKERYDQIFEEKNIANGTSAEIFLIQDTDPEEAPLEETEKAATNIEATDKEAVVKPTVENQATAKQDIENAEYQAVEPTVTETVPMEVFTGKYIELLNGVRTQEEIRTFLEGNEKELSSNLTLQDKLKYLESYEDTSLSNVTFERIAGEESNNGFTVDDYLTGKRLAELMAY